MKATIIFLTTLVSVSSAFADLAKDRVDACDRLAPHINSNVVDCASQLATQEGPVFSLSLTSNACSILELSVDITEGEKSLVKRNCEDPW